MTTYALYAPFSIGKMVMKSVRSGGRWGRTLRSSALSMSSSASPLTHLRVCSWNVNGIRAVFKHDPTGDALRSLFAKFQPDVLCLQETKIQESHVDDVKEDFFRIHADLNPTHSYWSCSRGRKGYSGTAVILFGDALRPEDITVEYGIGNPDGDLEGRSITLHHDLFSLVNVYVPNAGAALKRLEYRIDEWDAHLSDYMERLQLENVGRRAILTGDMNVAHRAIDYHNPHNPATKKQAGTTPEEQASFEEKFLARRESLQAPLLVDSYRRLYPEGDGYSFYSARKGEGGRQRREGLRIDYVLTNDHEEHSSDRGHEAYVEESVLHPYSDHCPVGATVRLL